MAGKTQAVESSSGGVVLITNAELRKILKEVLTEVIADKSTEPSISTKGGYGMFDGQLEDDQLIQLNDVLRLLRISKSSWWAGVKSGRFPAPIRLSAKTVRWSRRQILQIVQRGKEVGDD